LLATREQSLFLGPQFVACGRKAEAGYHRRFGANGGVELLEHNVPLSGFARHGQQVGISGNQNRISRRRDEILPANWYA